MISGMNGAPPLAIDSNAIYWTEEQYGGTVKKLNLTDGLVSILTTGITNSSAIIVDDSNIYWIEMSSFNIEENKWNADGSIKMIPKVIK